MCRVVPPRLRTLLYNTEDKHIHTIYTTLRGGHRKIIRNGNRTHYATSKIVKTFASAMFFHCVVFDGSVFYLFCSSCWKLWNISSSRCFLNSSHKIMINLAFEFCLILECMKQFYVITKWIWYHKVKEKPALNIFWVSIQYALKRVMILSIKSDFLNFPVNIS